MFRRFLAAVSLAVLAVAAFVLPDVLRDESPHGGVALAQEFGAPAAPTALTSAVFDPPQAGQGGKAKLRLTIHIAEGWHLYPQDNVGETPPRFKWTLPPFLTAGPLNDVTKPHEIDYFGEKKLVFDGELVLEQTFDVAADAPLGTVTVTGLGEWQRCDAGSCVNDKKQPVLAKLEIVVASAVPASAGAPSGKAPLSPTPKSASLGWALILKAIAAGGLTILTPCVFPLLPVTVSFFAKQKGPALPRSVVYALGIIFTITVIGLVFSTTIASFARGWIFNAAVGALFLVLSLSLFGMFDLRLPSFLLDWSTNKAGGGGLAGAFFMAMTLALTSFSCSMPFLAVMFEDFGRGDRFTAVLGLVVYSSTLAAPFFLCSLFPAALSALPRAGEWMNSVKVVMGFVEFGLAFKFLRSVALNFQSDALPRSLVLAIWVACCLGAAIYLLGFIVLPHDTKLESIGVVRMVFALCFMAFALYLGPGVSRQPLANWIEAFIQTTDAEISMASVPGGGGGGGAAQAHIPWVKNDWEGTLARAAEKRRPALFDFTGVG